jgi:hypothetical protein
LRGNPRFNHCNANARVASAAHVAQRKCIERNLYHARASRTHADGKMVNAIIISIRLNSVASRLTNDSNDIANFSGQIFSRKRVTDYVSTAQMAA